jgi:undecaprenyl-diphosphatase
LDTALEFLRSLAKLRSPFLDTVIQLITRLGEELIIFAVICICYWCISKSFAYRLGFTFFASGIAVQGLKVTCKIERPWVLDPNFKPVGTAIEAATGYSFPSGHAMNNAAIYITIMLCLLPLCKTKAQKGIVIAIFTIIPFIIGVSRIYFNVHFTSDVICGWCLGAIVAILMSEIPFIKKGALNEQN